ncbi:MAG: hypothetical protein KGI80_00930 [Verrucomicrobiota bacterium]|nr:hypothetical protein [Verrucomicrobiota bacterium]
MISFLKRLFFEHFFRKLLSLFLAIIVWLIVYRSMTTVKTVTEVPVRVINLKEGKTIEGMQTNGLLNERISLTLYGHGTLLDALGSRDLEVVLNAEGKPDEWIASISKQELVSLNPELNLRKGLSRIVSSERKICQSSLVKEEIPITVTEPIGEAPKGYQYLDVFPYHLNLTLVGPEKTIKRLKNRGGLQLTFNLNEISVGELEVLQSMNKGRGNEVSFFVPNAWKRLVVSELSEERVEIDDPRAKGLRIDFIREDLLPVPSSIPISLFFPTDRSAQVNPETCNLALGDFIVKKNGLKVTAPQLFVKGVSRKFLDLVKDRLQIVITLCKEPLWNVQFVSQQDLEDRFIARAIAEWDYALEDLSPQLREEYLRNRFRSYMHSFRLYTANQKKLKLAMRLEGDTVHVLSENTP